MNLVIETVNDFSLGLQSKAIGALLQKPTLEQVAELASYGNIFNDCTRLLFHRDALAPGNSTLKRIQRCVFNVPTHGIIIIDDLEGTTEVNGFMMMCGLRDSTFAGSCIISKHCLITSTSLIANVFIGESCSIIGCGQIVGSPQENHANNVKKSTTSFGNNETISVGPENGGRDIKVNIHHSYYDLCQSIYKFKNHQDIENNDDNNNNKKDKNDDNNSIIAIKTVSSSFTIICSNCILFKCDSIIECFIGEGCYLASSIIAFSTLLSTTPFATAVTIAAAAAITNRNDTIGSLRGVKITNNANVSYSLIHAGCTISNHCILDHVYMSESSSIDTNARVCQSILAPDVNIAGGECHHSVVGPFVGFHHHSLLIACLWPLGRGNTAYGAKIGANHTGRVNDQECWIGEGCFFGLNSSLKYPVNLVESPYSIIAPSTAVSPQKIQLPCSLILTLPMTMMTTNSYDNSGKMMNKQQMVDSITSTTTSSENTSLSPSTTVMNLQLQTCRLSPEVACLIKPGWVLYGNPYMLDRADTKFSSRSKSLHYYTAFPVIRPTLIATVTRARDGVHEFLKTTRHIKDRRNVLIVDEFSNNNSNNTRSSSNSSSCCCCSSSNSIGNNNSNISNGIGNDNGSSGSSSNTSSSSSVALVVSPSVAPQQLQQAAPSLLGLGKCASLLVDLDRAVHAYNALIRRYALHGFLFLLLKISAVKHSTTTSTSTTTTTDDGDDDNTRSDGIINSDSDDNNNDVALVDLLSIIQQINQQDAAGVGFSTNNAVTTGLVQLTDTQTPHQEIDICNQHHHHKQQQAMIQQDLLYFKPIVTYYASSSSMPSSMPSSSSSSSTVIQSNTMMKNANNQPLTHQQPYMIGDINLLKTLLPGTTNISSSSSSSISSSSSFSYSMFHHQLFVLSHEYSDELKVCQFFDAFVIDTISQQQNSMKNRRQNRNISGIHKATVSGIETAIPIITHHHLNHQILPSSSSSSSSSSSLVKACIQKLLNELIQIEQDHADAVALCRVKDNERGIAIIPDYQYVNSAAAAAVTANSTSTTTTTNLNICDNTNINDAIVKRAQKRSQDLKTLVTTVFTLFDCYS